MEEIKTVSNVIEAANQEEEVLEPVNTLTEEQLAVVNYTGEKPLVVLADPGSGKTKTLIERVKKLVANGVPSEKICVLSFTNSAADEFSSRLAEEDITGARVSTAHSLCNSLLRFYCKQAGLNRNFSIITPAEAVSLGLSGWERNDGGDAMMTILSRAKIEGYTPDSPDLSKVLDLVEQKNWQKKIFTVEEVRTAYLTYENNLHKLNNLGEITMLDFSDLIIKTCELLEANADVKLAIRNGIDHLMVDEYQDDNAIQIRLEKLLAGQGCSVVKVGDPNQAIFGFNGSDVTYIIEDLKNPDVEKLNISESFRCSKSVVNLVNAFRENDYLGNPNTKGMTTSNPAGKMPMVYISDTKVKEHESIVQVLKKIPKDSTCAVTFRTNAQIANFKEYCVAMGHKKLAERFVEKKSQQATNPAIESYFDVLRMIGDPQDPESMSKFFDRIGFNEFADILRTSTSRLNYQDLRTFIRDSGYCNTHVEAKNLLDPESDSDGNAKGSFFVALRNACKGSNTLAMGAEEFLNSKFSSLGTKITFSKAIKDSIKDPDFYKKVEDYHKDLKEKNVRRIEAAQFIAEYKLRRNEDVPADDIPGMITLSTIHKVKGKQYDYVLISSLKGFSNTPEEHRVCYVALTRPKAGGQLFLFDNIEDSKVSYCIERISAEHVGGNTGYCRSVMRSGGTISKTEEDDSTPYYKNIKPPVSGKGTFEYPDLPLMACSTDFAMSNKDVFKGVTHVLVIGPDIDVSGSIKKVSVLPEPNDKLEKKFIADAINDLKNGENRLLVVGNGKSRLTNKASVIASKIWRGLRNEGVPINAVYLEKNNTKNSISKVDFSQMEKEWKLLNRGRS